MSKENLQRRVEPLTPQEMESKFSRQQRGVFDWCSYVNLLFGEDEAIVNAAESIKRAMALGRPSGVNLPEQAFEMGSSRVLFDSADWHKFHWREVGGLSHAEACPFNDLRLVVRLTRLGGGRRWKNSRGAAFLLNLGGKDLLVRDVGKRSGIIRPQTIEGPFARRAVVWGEGVLLTLEMEEISGKIKLAEKAGTSLRHLIDDAYSVPGPGKVSHDGGNRKIWLWGPTGGVNGILDRCAIGVYVSKDALIETEDAYLHPFNSQVVIALPLYEDLKGVRPIFSRTGAAIGTIALGRIGVWEGDDWEYEVQKIMPPGFLYLLVHAYSKQEGGRVNYLKQTKVPRFGESFGAEVERVLNLTGISTVD